MVAANDDRDPLFPQFRLGSPEASAARVAAIGQRGYNPARPNANSPVPNWDAGLAAPTGVINTNIGAGGGVPQGAAPTEQLAATTPATPRERTGRAAVPPPYQDNPFTVADEPFEQAPPLDMDLFTPARDDPEPEEPTKRRPANPFRERDTYAAAVDEGVDDPGEMSAQSARPAPMEAPPRQRSSSSGSSPQTRGRMPRMQRASAEFEDVMASIDARLFGGEG